MATTEITNSSHVHVYVRDGVILVQTTNIKRPLNAGQALSLAEALIKAARGLHLK